MQSSWNCLQRSLPHLLLVASAAPLAIGDNAAMGQMGCWPCSMLCQLQGLFSGWFYKACSMDVFLDKRQSSNEQLNCWWYCNCAFSLCKELHPFSCTISKCSRNETKALEDWHFSQISFFRVCSTRCTILLLTRSWWLISIYIQSCIDSVCEISSALSQMRKDERLNCSEKGEERGMCSSSLLEFLPKLEWFFWGCVWFGFWLVGWGFFWVKGSPLLSFPLPLDGAVAGQELT